MHVARKGLLMIYMIYMTNALIYESAQEGSLRKNIGN